MPRLGFKQSAYPAKWRRLSWVVEDIEVDKRGDSILGPRMTKHPKPSKEGHDLGQVVEQHLPLPMEPRPGPLARSFVLRLQSQQHFAM